MDKVTSTLSTEEFDHVAEKSKSILARMTKLPSKTLGSVTNGPYRNFFLPSHVSPKHPFRSVGEFFDQYRQMLSSAVQENSKSVLFYLPHNVAIQFTHGGLLPQNILVSGSNMSAIVDWSTAGFYPASWECCCTQLS